MKRFIKFSCLAFGILVSMGLSATEALAENVCETGFNCDSSNYPTLRVSDNLQLDSSIDLAPPYYSVNSDMSKCSLVLGGAGSYRMQNRGSTQLMELTTEDFDAAQLDVILDTLAKGNTTPATIYIQCESRKVAGTFEKFHVAVELQEAIDPNTLGDNDPEVEWP